jgi:hypothetical protein
MPELGSYGSVRGAAGNSRPYRERRPQTVPLDQDRRRHPGKHPTLLPSHTRRKCLE